MSMPLPELKLRLLNVLFLRDASFAPTVNDLTAEDWAYLRYILLEHRLVPLMHWRLTHHYPELPVPQAFRDFCSLQYKAWAFRALQVRRELLEIHRILTEAGIRHALLKGAWLAYHAYPRPAMRPMGDIDVLVPDSDVLRAFNLLLDHGYQQLDYFGTPERWAEVSNHLPPLRSPLGQLSIELHLRLCNPAKSVAGHDFELSADEGFWDRMIAVDFAGVQLCYLSPTDLLIHLIIHGVVHHRFSNGPLLISDMAYVIEGSPIDWKCFWALVEKGGHTRAAVLALRLLQHFRGPQSIDWPAHLKEGFPLSSEMLDTVSAFTLRSVAASGSVHLLHDLSQAPDFAGNVRTLISKIFPPTWVIAMQYQVSEHSWQAYAWYPVRWWRILRQTLPALLRARKQGVLHSEKEQLDQLDLWLNQP